MPTSLMPNTNIDKQHHLVLGGARSGKSRFAEQLITRSFGEQQSSKAYYLATAEALDDEMRKRIEHHQQDREQAEKLIGFEWNLIEEPLEISKVINSLSNHESVLIECLTLWLNNCLHHQCWPEQKQLFLESLNNTAARIVMVSNEVGNGIVPSNKLARDFIDEAGWLHQELAQHCTNVSLITAGLAQPLKQPLK